MEWIASPEEEVKAALRKYFIDKRQLSLSETAQQNIRENLLEFIIKSQARAVALTWPMRGEVDLRPLFKELLVAHKNILLPQVVDDSRGLVFYPWTEQSYMKAGILGTFYPSHPEYDKAGVKPDLIVVPCLTFDRAGYRLGYGKGLYDRALASNPQAELIGYCSGGVHFDFLPRERHDIPINRYSTPAGVVLTGL